MYKNNGIFVIFVTFLVLNLFYIYNFNLYPHIVYNVINILKFIKVPELFIDSLLVYNKTCNDSHLEPQVICSSIHFPTIVGQANNAIVFAELCHLLILIFKYTLLCIKIITHNKQSTRNATLKIYLNEHISKVHYIYQTMVWNIYIILQCIYIISIYINQFIYIDYYNDDTSLLLDTKLSRRNIWIMSRLSR